MYDGAHIAIENSPGIGDLIVLTPILREIKTKYPHCVITILSRKKSSLDAIKRIPYIDHVHFMGNGSISRIKTFLMLRHQDYLLLNSYQGAVARLAKLAGVKYRTGNCKDKYKNTNLFTHPLPYTNNGSFNQYIIDFLIARVNLALDEKFKITDYQCDVSLPTQEEIDSVKAKMKQNNWHGEKYVVLSVQGNTAAALPIHTIVCCISTIISLGDYVVLSGTKSEKLNQAIKEVFFGDKHIINLLGKTTLYEMIAAISLANQVVTTNSGPLHIATALRKPTIAFFTSGNRKEWQPKQHCQVISLNVPCSKKCLTESKHCQHICTNFSDDFVQAQLRKLLIGGKDGK